MAINVTKSFFPPIEEYQDQLRRIWANEWLTNRGELVLELEEKLKTYLEVQHILVTNNGTVPIQIALKLLGKGGEIITTPFSYVATTSSIVWENCTPVFVDIHPEYLTIDETKIEAKITSKTTAILATHVFGNPCYIEVIEKIAKKYKLKVIYDAAHCFDVKYNRKSVFEYGDISTCSFHATKIFHTGEGGAVFTKDKDLQHQIFYSHNFGHDGQLAFYGLGINGKISELQAAMGLAVLPHMPRVIANRQKIVEIYDQAFSNIPLQLIKIRPHTDWNFSYYPIVLKNEAILDKVIGRLNEVQIYPRRYFYPSLDTLPYVDDCELPIASRISKSIICLPLYHDLEMSAVDKIIRIIKSVIC
ncbi:DegT/DnrJ/EryC1/StrS aminotransferase family protein [Winogradskyella sp.]|uniref:DegT/DnrJ/EryC1/StrS family aminotransferase n=1 Tax=Winogradskyella sp. TaxID=1883156 RepID=UPI00261D1664|nr:DegT/DnrJ/EryC1/StrS family aminotransferase [Winogradskyella sp.]